MKAPGCASALEKLKPEDGAGAEAVTGATALEPPTLKTEEGAAGVEVAPPPKMNGLNWFALLWLLAAWLGTCDRFFTGPRCLWGPVYGSRCLSLVGTPYESFG